MDMHQEMDLQLFADAGTLVNAGGNYVNAYTGEKTAFPEGGGMTASMKTFYDTELLENARPELIHTQFARKQVLPAGRGKTVEWRKWNTLEDAGALTEGVIPTGQKFGQSAVTQAVTQYGTYVSVSDQLELHAIDDVILGAAEELGASAGTTQDKLVRNVVVAGTNVQYCDKVGTNGAHTAVTSRAGLDTTAKLTPDEVNKAVTLLKKLKAPKIDGKYVAIIHPSVAYDLRSSDAWVEAHKYAGITELFTGEIGELHGVRFIETTEAKVINGEGCPVKTAADESNGTPAEYYSVYATLFLGKDAYGMIDLEGRQHGDDHQGQGPGRRTAQPVLDAGLQVLQRGEDPVSGPHGARGELRRVFRGGRGELTGTQQGGAQLRSAVEQRSRRMEWKGEAYGTSICRDEEHHAAARGRHGAAVGVRLRERTDVSGAARKGGRGAGAGL